MSGRPEALFPLFAEIESLPGIGTKTGKLLRNLDISAPKDLLLTLPYAGIDRRLRHSVATAEVPATVTVEITVGPHRPPATKARPYRVDVADAEAEFQLVFFHARPDWVRKNLPEGARRVVSGRLERFDGRLQMVHPDHILETTQAGDLPEFEPVYPLTQGITQRLMARAAAAAVERAPDLAEWIDPELCKRRGWPRWKMALATAHAPSGPGELSPQHPARVRLAYDEFFAHQTTLALVRRQRRKRKGRPSLATGILQNRVLAALPYRPTAAQARSIAEIQSDMAAPERMSRLLQGDVGAGKTLVAFMALLTAVEAGGQGVMMAPTEILARQHMSGLEPLAASAGVGLEILTGRDKGRDRAEKLDRLASGEIGILVGTHAVFQKDVAFHDLRLAVVDEQHRFGVAQRLELGKKGDAVDMLVMTATPIPRSLSLASYGDLDLSVLDEKPPGRTPVTTALVSSQRLDEVTGHLQSAIAEGRQAYWVCPLVDESETVALTAAEERFKALRAVFGDGTVGLVHGQLPAAEKDAAMAAFKEGRIRLLVATTVIEVGVDVPNASIMVIEGAESFGLAQLHQLRGRVGRGAEKSTCLLMYTPPLSETGRRRLEILRETDDGFRIAEEDLAMRGAGDLLGTAQSGLPRFRVADLEGQQALMATAQSDARRLVETDPDLATPRGEAVRVLLWLLGQDRAIRLLSVG